MTTGKKHLKLIKRFYGTYVDKNVYPSFIMFHTPTSSKDFTLEKGRYICFIDDAAYLINLDRPDWRLSVNLKGIAYINYKNKDVFMEGLYILNFVDTSVSYITKLNDIQKFDFYGLLRVKYMKLESRSTGLYLIKN